MNIEDIFDNIKDPIWGDSEHNTIVLTVTLKGYEGVHSFVASENDFESHGREVYNNAINLKYGEISPYINPDDSVDNELEAKMFFDDERRIALRIEEDWRLGLDVTDDEMKQVKLYLKSLKRGEPIDRPRIME